MDLETAVAQALQQTEALLRAGKRAEAHAILVQVVERVPDTVHAWYLLSFTLSERERQVECLLQVLQLNPEHTEARARLAKIAPNVKPPAPVAAPEPEPEPEPIYTPAPQPEPTSTAPAAAPAQDLFSLRAKLQNEPVQPASPQAAPAKPEPRPLPQWLERFQPQLEQLSILGNQPGVQRLQRQWKKFLKKNPDLPRLLLGVVVVLLGLCILFYGGTWAWNTQIRHLFDPTNTPTATKITFPTLPPEWTVTPTPSRTPQPTLTPTITFTPTETGTPTPSPTATRRR